MDRWEIPQADWKQCLQFRHQQLQMAMLQHSSKGQPTGAYLLISVYFKYFNIESASNELLNADAQLLASKLKAAGVALSTHEEPKAHHGWQLLPDILPEAKQSAERLGQFLA